MADPAFANYSTQSWQGNGGANFAHSVGTTDYRILIVYYESSDWVNIALTTATYAGVAMTLQFSVITNYGGTRPSAIAVFYLVSPTSGENTVIVNTNGGNSTGRHSAAAVTYTGASTDSSNVFKSGQEKSTAFADNSTASFSHSPTADDSSLVVNAWATIWASGHDGREAGQTERLEIGDGGAGGLSVTDRDGTAAAVTVSGSDGSSDDGIAAYSWSHVLLPPQNVTVDASAVPASVATAAAIGAVDDRNIGINADFLRGTLSVTIGSITERPPIEADMVVRNIT